MLRPRRIAMVAAVLLAGGLAWGWYTVTRPDYRLHRAQQALRADDLDAAEAAAAALQADGCTDAALLLRGEMLLRRGEQGGGTADFLGALSTLNRLSADNPYRVGAANLSARCLLRLGNLSAAERSFAFVLSEQPDDIDAHRGLMALYYDLGALGQANEHAERWAALDPHDGRPMRFMGLVQKDLGRNAEAVPFYRAALERTLTEQVRHEVCIELTECLLRTGKYADARDVLDADRPGEPLAATYLTLSAECARGLGEPARARELVDQALDVKATHTPALRLRGQLALDAGDLAHAGDDLQRAVAIAPKEYETHHLLAQVYARQGRTREAKEEQERVKAIQADWEEITRLTKAAIDRPKDVSLHRHMAEVFARLDMPQMAANQRRLAAALTPPVAAAPPPP